MRTIISQTGRFTDCDEWCAAAAGWNLHLQQLDGGQLDAVMNRAVTPELVVQHVSLSRRFHQAGDPPDDLFTFGVPGDYRRVRWFDHSKPQHGIMNFNRSSGFDCVSDPGFTAHTFSVSSASFIEDCHALGATDNDVLVLRRQGMIALSPDESTRLALLGTALTRCAAGAPSDETGAMELAADIRYLLAMTLTSPEDMGGLRAQALRQRAVDKALEAIHASNGLISVPEVCEFAATSGRSLSRGFRERFGISTKQYMVATRLSAARRELLGTASSVTDAASRFGFWHLGRFSDDYRSMFGELPSDTLVRRN